MDISLGMKNRIEEFRKKKGLSQEALGDLIGVQKAKISKLENGNQKLTMDYITRLADALGIKPWELIAPAEDIDRLIQNKEEEDIVKIRRQLNEKKQSQFDAMVKGIELAIKAEEEDKNDR